MEEISLHLVASLGGLLLGSILGATVEKTNFCTMGAIADLAFMSDSTRLRAWFLAIAVAIAGAHMLALAEFVDLNESLYRNATLSWLGPAAGGVVFGIGMVLGGGCGSRNLARIGSGDLRALVVTLVLGLSAEMTLKGLFAVPRAELLQITSFDLSEAGYSGQAVAELFGLSGLGAALFALIVAAVIAGWCVYSPGFRRSKAAWSSGLIIGLLVCAGWYVTGHLAFDEFDPRPPTSLTFVAPVGESFLYLMTYTGSQISFGIACVFGVVLGAFIAAKQGKTFRIQGFVDHREMLRLLVGGLMMGVGGVTALGCTIGQGITGMSTLALGSVIALAAIIAGGFIGIKLLEILDG